MTQSYEVIVVGAGMVGAALACALAQDGVRVALVDGVEPESKAGHGPYDLRVSALTHASRRLLESLQAWPTIAAARVSPFRHMHVWDAGGGSSIHFDAAEVGQDTLGHIVENRLIQSALHERMQSMNHVDRIIPAQLESLHVDADAVTAILQDGRSLQARLLVGADGVQSTVRKLAGIATRGWAYDQHGVVATVRPQRFHEETAWQRFLPDGPLAFLPLADGTCSIVWSARPAHAEALLQMEDAAFRNALEHAFESRLGPILESGKRLRFPLRLQHASNYVQSRVALVGDAAHSIHPLAGQGVNLGFLDAAALAEVLLQGRSHQRDLGEFRLLRRYERWRKGDNLATMAVMDGFKRLFGAEAAPLKWLRNAGLGLVDRAGPVKRTIIEHAMGLSGDLPRMVRAGDPRP